VKGILEMTRFTIPEIAHSTGGRIERHGQGEALGVATDSRRLSGGEVFLTLVGPRHDGHEYLGDAFRSGAWGAIVENRAWEREAVRNAAAPFPERPIVVVEDTCRALGDLARFHRSRLPVRVVGVTGSNGKTTTKEMAAAIAGRRWQVHKSEGNFNNLVGLPLSVFGLEERHQVAVLEMGMNRSGEIRRLAEIAAPEVGVVTNIAPAHLEHFGSMEGVIAAKAELLDSLGAGGTAILNADDPSTAALEVSVRGRRLTFGTAREADFRAQGAHFSTRGTVFTLVCPAGRVGIELSLLGEHNVSNALSAAAAAFALGAGLTEIRDGLRGVQSVAMRFEVRNYAPGVTVVNDAYNANPASMRAALNSLRLLPRPARRAAVLGDMQELGEASVEAHRALGREAANSNLDLLAAVGRFRGEVARGAREAGFAARKLHLAENWLEAAGILKGWLRPGDQILLKGSRELRLEEVLRTLQDEGVLTAGDPKGEGS
jgi:UDP-N-acetylmuramoyl-tripeptide--D-alanyl-D-alanine ligase